jgi:N-acetylneuraminic acid mutarotase
MLRLLVVYALAMGITSAVLRSAIAEERPPLPDAHGFAGMYAGGDANILVAAGGHQFSNGVPWWDGGTKVWSDRIFLYDSRAQQWRTATARLARALGDGASVWYRGELYCAGGGDGDTASGAAFCIQPADGDVRFRRLPPLPVPTMRGAYALLGDHFVIIGGRVEPNSREATRAVWALNLKSPETWKRLPDFPGAARMMSVAAVAGEHLYIFGGIEIYADVKGEPINRAPYLRDAYRFSLASGRWEKLADVPRPIAGAPSPAAVQETRIFIVGGVDGAIESIADRSSISSLPDDVVAYDLVTGTWTAGGTLQNTLSRVNAPTVSYGREYLIIGGEHLPARRTNRVSTVHFTLQKQ